MELSLAAATQHLAWSKSSFRLCPQAGNAPLPQGFAKARPKRSKWTVLDLMTMVFTHW